MNNFALRALRPLIVLLFAGSLLVQLGIVPLAAWQIIHDVPNRTAGILYGIAGFFAVLACQVALVALWKLLTMVRSDDIFSPDSLRWVDLIIRMGWVITGLCLFVTTYQFIWGDFGPLPVPLALGGSVVAALSVTLLVLVLRKLLESAANYKAELAEVV